MNKKKKYSAPLLTFNVISFYKDIATIVDPGISTSMNLGKTREDYSKDDEEEFINYMQNSETSQNPLW